MAPAESDVDISTGHDLGLLVTLGWFSSDPETRQAAYRMFDRVNASLPSDLRADPPGPRPA